MNTRVRRPSAARAAIVATILLTILASTASTASVVVGASGLCLVIIWMLLWNGSDPPILLLPALFQWSEVALQPLSTIWLQVPLNNLSPYGADLEYGALYGLAGVAALSMGLYLGAGRTSGTPLAVRLRLEAADWQFRSVARFAFAAIAAGYVLAAISGQAGPAREVINQASNIKYVGLFVLVYWCLVRRSHTSVVVGVMAFEIVFGMTGFFAQFKSSVLTFFIAAIAARPRLRSTDVAVVAIAATLIVFVAAFWSVVKPEYRKYLNQGSDAQTVSVPISGRLSYLQDAATSFDSAQLADGIERLVARHAYIEFLALTLENVPRSVPHEDGQLTLAVIAHMAMPRFLFPNKPILSSDTEIMAKYTGLTMTWNEHTSISIGNLGELYIDFGLFGGLVAAGVVGWLVGNVYRVLRRHRGSPALITSGLCLMVALQIAYFGTAYVKLMGAFVYCAIISVLVQRRGLPRILPWVFDRPLRVSRSGALPPRA